MSPGWIATIPGSATYQGLAETDRKSAEGTAAVTRFRVASE
jgi:hypothetical protein